MHSGFSRFRLTALYSLWYPLLACLPARAGYLLATTAGRLAARLQPARLAAADAALRQVFPSLSAAQRRANLLSQQGLLAREKLDVFRLGRLCAEDLGRMIRLDGLDHLRQAMATGRPVILYSAHFGRLIMPAMGLGLMGIKTSCLTADTAHPRIPLPEQRYLAFKLREMQRLMGGEMIQRSAPLRRLFRVLKAKGVLVVILDAPPAANDSVESFPFLGGRARLSAGTLRLARRTGALLVPYFALERNSAVEGRILPAVDLTGLDDAAALARLFAPIEQHIRHHPDHWWLWQILSAVRQPRPTPPIARADAPELA